MVFNGEGCATIVLSYTYTESVEEWRKKNYDEEGGKKEKERKGKKTTV